MAFKAACPSCGAPVSFRSSVSLMAVCEFCRSTLLRHDKKIEDIGKMGDLLPDQSILQVGTQGVYEGVHFSVIGRIQIRYEAGLWNEWHILFDNMKGGWLSEAGGNSWITFPHRLNTPLSASQIDSLEPGQQIELDKHYYTVTNIDKAECVAGAGELPFQVGAGYPLTSIDLREGDSGRVATLDTSQDPALFFIGRQISLNELKLSNTRSLAEQAVALPAKSLKSFACPRCAAPLTVYSQRAKTIACGSCGALVEADNPTKRLVEQVLQAQAQAPCIALGSAGTMYGQQWTAIGFMIRQADIYKWQEYLLMNALGEFAWLVNSDGHWSFGRAINGVPKTGALNIRHWLGDSFEHFERSYAKVVYVLGEFYWRISLDDSVCCDDYVAPPRMLSAESAYKEINWTLLEYVDREEVEAAFDLDSALPEPQGVGAIEPNPYQITMPEVAKQCLWLGLAALLVHLLFAMLLPHGELVNKELTFEPGISEDKLLARIHLDAPVRHAIIKGESSLNNSWVDLGFTLVNEKTGEEMNAFNEVSYYSGWEGGESWQEGRRDFKTFMGDLAPGDYLITVDAETEPGRYIGARLRIEYGELALLNLILIEAFYLVLVLFFVWRKYSFEVARWADSDHPKISDEGEDE